MDLDLSLLANNQRRFWGICICIIAHGNVQGNPQRIKHQVKQNDKEQTQ